MKREEIGRELDVGDVVSGPLYSGQDDHCCYVIIDKVLGGERISGIEDERDHNRIREEPPDASGGFLCLNLASDEAIDRAIGYHRPARFKIWRDHPNLDVHEDKVLRAHATIRLAEFQQQLEEKTRASKNDTYLLKCLLTTSNKQ